MSEEPEQPDTTPTPAETGDRANVDNAAAAAKRQQAQRDADRRRKPQRSQAPKPQPLRGRRTGAR